MGWIKNKFSFTEMFSNENGKTSGTAFCGVIICIVGTITFFLGCIDKMWVTHTVDVISQSIVFVGIGATLMGVRKVFDIKKPESETPPQEEMINS